MEGTSHALKEGTGTMLVPHFAQKIGRVPPEEFGQELRNLWNATEEIVTEAITKVEDGRILPADAFRMIGSIVASAFYVPAVALLDPEQVTGLYEELKGRAER